MLEVAKKIIYGIWGVLVLVLAYLYFTNPQAFSPEGIASFIESSSQQLFLGYIFLTFFRGFFLIPSTPFVLGGILLFPDRPMGVLLISLAGVMFSAALLYYFADWLKFSDYLKNKHPKKLVKVEEKLHSPKAFWFITAWSVFPFVPTDLVCYLSGVVKVPVAYMLLGVLVGELLLISFCIYFSANILTV